MRKLYPVRDTLSLSQRENQHRDECSLRTSFQSARFLCSLFTIEKDALLRLLRAEKVPKQGVEKKKILQPCKSKELQVLYSYIKQ